MCCQTKPLVLFWSLLEILHDKQISTFAISICRQQEIPQLVNQAHSNLRWWVHSTFRQRATFYNNRKDNICSALFSESDPISKSWSFQVVYTLLLNTVASKPCSSFLCIFRAAISKDCDWKLLRKWEKEAKGSKCWNPFSALNFSVIPP